MALTFADRLAAVARFEHEIYGEIAGEEPLTGEAVLTVGAIGLAHGLAQVAAGGLAALFAAVAAWCCFWLLWVVGIWLLARLAGPEPDFSRLFRALAYAALPFSLALFGEIWLLGPIASAAAWILGFAAVGIAVREVTELAGAAVWGISAAALVAALGLSAPLRALL